MKLLFNKYYSSICQCMVKEQVQNGNGNIHVLCFHYGEISGIEYGSALRSAKESV